MSVSRFRTKLEAFGRAFGPAAIGVVALLWWFMTVSGQPDLVRELIMLELGPVTNVCFRAADFPDGHHFDSWVVMRPGTSQVLVTEQHPDGDKCFRYAEGATGSQRVSVRVHPATWKDLPGPEATPCGLYRQECDFVMTLDDNCCVRPLEVRDAP